MATESVVVLPGMLPRDHDGRAELAEGAGECEQTAGEDSAPGERQGDEQEDPPFRSTERAGHLFQLRVDFLDGGTGVADQQRQRHHGQGQNHRLPGEDDIRLECLVQPCPDGPRLPKRRSSTKPVTTGGRTSGRATSVSTSVLPGHALRASSQPSAIPGGRISAVPSNAIATEKATI